METLLLAALVLAVVGWIKAVRYRRAAIQWREVAVKALELNNQAIATNEALLLERMRRESRVLTVREADLPPSAPLH